MADRGTRLSRAEAEERLYRRQPTAPPAPAPAEQAVEHESQHGTPVSKQHRKWLLLGIIGLSILLGLALVCWLVFGRTDSNKGLSKATRQAFIDQQRSVNFPVYYPATPPQDSVIESSFSPGQLFSFTATFPNDKKLAVIEQPRPSVMEKVTKTQDVANSIGTAYIADLNGQKAGFVVTDKTLITISGASVGAAEIVSLIQSLKPVN